MLCVSSLQMEHSEMVCRSCGVSYLIFPFFSHQLHTQQAQLETELQEQRERPPRGRRSNERHRSWAGWSVRGHLTWRCKETESTLREEFEQKNERERREMKEEYKKKRCNSEESWGGGPRRERKFSVTHFKRPIKI